MTATLTEESAAATAERFVIADGYEPVRHREGEGHRGMPFLPTLIVDIPEAQMDRMLPEHRPSVGDVVQARVSTSVDQYFYETPYHGSVIFNGSRINHPVDTSTLVGLPDGTVMRTTHVREASVTGEVVYSPTGITGTLTAGRWIELQPKPGTTGSDGSPLLTETVDADRLSGEITLSGTVPLRPAPEDGQLYVLWDQGPFNEATEYRVSRWHEASKSFWGIYKIEHSRNGTHRRHNLGVYSGNVREALESQQFVAADGLAPADQPEKEGSPALMEHYNAALAQLDTRREEYSDRLNELAEENSYCSEFEAIVQGVGLPGRTKTRKNLSVELEVEVRLTDESPSSRVDSIISDDSGAEGLSLSSAEYSGTLRVTLILEDVELTEESSYDDVYDELDRSDIEDAVETSLRGYNLSELEGWTVLGTSIAE